MYNTLVTLFWALVATLCNYMGAFVKRISKRLFVCANKSIGKSKVSYKKMPEAIKERVKRNNPNVHTYFES